MKPIRTRARTTKWNLFFHYFTVVYAIISGIVLVPLYLHFIPINIYGAWLATGNIVAWVSMVDPGLSTVLMQRVSMAYGRRNDELSGLFTNGMFFSLIFAVLICLVGYLASTFILMLVNIDPTSESVVLVDAFLMAVFGMSLMIISYGITAFSQGLQSSLGIGIIFSVSTILSLGVSVFMLFLGYGLLAIPAALIFRGAALIIGNSIYLLWRVRQENINMRLTLDGFSRLKSELSYSFTGRTANLLATNMDSFVVARYIGVEAAAILSLTKKAPDLSRIFLERPAIAFMPAIASLYGEGKIDRVGEILQRLLIMIIWLTGLACSAFICLNEPFVTLWVGPELYSGSKVNIAIVVGLALTVFSRVFSSYCYALGNIKGNSMATFSQSMLAIPLMFFGAREFGMIGVAVAPSIAIILISSWYYPRVFMKLIKLDGRHALKLVREFLIAIMIFTIVIFLEDWMTIVDWFDFLFWAVLMVVVYAALLSLLSSSFRVELKIFVIKIQPVWSRK